MVPGWYMLVAMFAILLGVALGAIVSGGGSTAAKKGGNDGDGS